MQKLRKIKLRPSLLYTLQPYAFCNGLLLTPLGCAYAVQAATAKFPGYVNKEIYAFLKRFHHMRWPTYNRQASAMKKTDQRNFDLTEPGALIERLSCRWDSILKYR